MRKMRAVLGFTVVLAISLSILPLVGHSADEPLVLEEGGFEIPPVLEAKDFLAPELFKGDYFQVDPNVPTDGFENRSILSPRILARSWRMVMTCYASAWVKSGRSPKWPR